MKISKDDRKAARRLLKLCIRQDGSINEQNLQLIAHSLTSQKPRHYLAILSALCQLARLQYAKRQVTVKSAIPLTLTEQDEIMLNLAAQYGEGLHYEWIVQPSLIAGIHLQVGDNVLDGTLKSRIDQLMQSTESLSL